MQFLLFIDLRKRMSISERCWTFLLIDVREFALSILKSKSERDLQVSIGASDFSTPCTFCLAHKLKASWQQMRDGLPYHGDDNKFWLGAVIGTAIHEYLEKRIPDHYPAALIEEKIELGELIGYGVVKSKPDVLFTLDNQVNDWKTTSKEKLVFLKRALKTKPDEIEVTALGEARFTAFKYRAQAHSYARGLVAAGYPVEWVSLCFIVRGGLTDADVWAYTEPYDPEFAEHIWNRLERLWLYVREGQDIEKLPRHTSCQSCKWRD
jgi:hypothetical protein